jgi:hypothetical protein
MNFIHSREYLSKGDVVVVDCSHQCNIMITTDSNFGKYKSGQRFEYCGGHYKMLPAEIIVPKTGYWNITIDLGGRSARIKHSIQIIKK